MNFSHIFSFPNSEIIFGFKKMSKSELSTALTLVLLLLSLDMSSSNESSEISEEPPVNYEQKTVLAFGGNGFIGSEVITRMLERNYKITVVSRGNWYFDSGTRIRPHVKQVICDRENSDLEFCTDLIQVINETEHFDIVIDFSAYKPEVISDALEYLNGKVGVYIYISTDSVYEVSVFKQPGTGTASKETDARRPDDEDQRDQLNDMDSYGDNKLAGEEVLMENNKATGMKYLIFRLADVIGPRDTTDRWWTYQMWIQFYDFIKVPLFIPPEVAKLRTSYTFVKDIAAAVLLGIDKGPEVWNEAYNLGLDRDFSLQEFLQDLAKEVGSQIQFNFEASERAFNLFPSVTRGSMDISKAKEVLGFKPTSWEDALKENVEFYKDAFYNFLSERDDIAHQITKYVLPRNRKGSFLQMIEQLDRGLHISKQEL